MKLNLSKLEILYSLNGLYEKYLVTKTYFNEHNEEEVVGMSTPKEIRDVYNSILDQVQEQKECTSLNKIK